MSIPFGAFLRRKILIICLLLFAVFATVFRSQLYDFFFSVDGLSIAPSEICLVNQSGSDVIVELDTFVGSKVESFLFVGEKVCAPSPNRQTLGNIDVGLAGEEKFLCSLSLKQAGTKILKNIEPSGQCVWSE